MIDYNAFLIILAGLALIGGIVYGLYYNKIFTFFKLKQNRNNIHNSISKREEKKEESEEITKFKIIKKDFQLLEDEIKIYKFEKDLVSQALENILVASKNKTIDPFEKDRLLLKYNDQLKKLNKKMEKLQSEIDVTKLLELRHDLISILENKIVDIDEKIKEINFNFNNKSIKNNKLKDYHSFYDIEGIVDANLNSRKVINYKNSNLNKKKETIVEAEKEKIVNLKEQVLTALNRLDRAEIIKEELESKIVVMEENHNKNDSIKDEKLSGIQNKNNFDTRYLNLNEDKNSSGITNKEKVDVPKIFNFLKNIQSNDENDKINNNNNTKTSYNIISSPLLKNNIATTQSIIKNDENVNKRKIDNSLNKNRYQSNYNDNKSNSNSSSSKVNSSSPLFYLLNNNKLKVEHSINNNDYNSNRDKSKDKQYLNQERSKKFKFPLSFVFSKRNKKEKETENKKNYHDTNTEKRRDSLSNMLK